VQPVFSGGANLILNLST